MTRDELLEALLIERYNGGGWATPPRDPAEDNAAAARRVLLDEVEDRPTIRGVA